MKPASSRGFGTKAVFGANFVSTSPNLPSSKLPLTASRPLDSVPLTVTTSARRAHALPQVPHLKPLADASLDSDVPDVMPWYNGETAHEYSMHLLALSGSDAFIGDSEHASEALNQELPKKSGFSKLKGAVLATSLLNSAARKSLVRADNPKALAAFKTLSALSDEEKLMYPSWMTEGDIQTRKFLAQKIVTNRNRMRALMIRADEMLGTDDLRETLAKKYGLNEATYTEVADMISNNRIKVKSVFDDIHAVTQEQQSVLQEVQRALASTNTDLNFEISNLEDRLDDLHEDSLLQDAERSLGHAKSMRIKLSASHSRFLDQAVERLTTKMPQVVKTKHMEEDLVLAADSLESMRKVVHECKANTLKHQKEAQEKSEALKLCQKELVDVSKDRDRLSKIEKELRSNVDIWREKFYQCDRDLTTELRRSEEAERQHAAILEITLRNAQKVVEDRIEETARVHAEQLRKLNSIMSQLEHDLMYEKRLRDPDAVLKNAEKLSSQKNASKPSSIVQQLEDLQSENEALQKTVDRLIGEVNAASDEKESLHVQIAAITLQLTNESFSHAAEKATQISEMQVRNDNLTSLLNESHEKIERCLCERDNLDKMLAEKNEEISNLKLNYVNSQVAVATRSNILINPEKASVFSVGTQTTATPDIVAIGRPTEQTVKSIPQAETLQSQPANYLAEATEPPDRRSPESSTFSAMKPPGTAKIMCGTQTDVPYPRIGEDSARLAISCTRPECLAKLDEIRIINERANVSADAKAQEAKIALSNQLAARDREHKSATLKLKKEMDVKLAFERDSFTRAQSQLEQFRGAVKNKLESVMVEIKKMKRIGDFSNVGEVELHLNDVYIGATENFDAYQAEINARNQDASQLEVDREIEKCNTDNDSPLPGINSENAAKNVRVKNSKLGAASKAIMFTQAAGKALRSSVGSSGDANLPDAHHKIVSVDDLKTTAERFIYATQQFMNGCSFGINSSSVSLERTQKKLVFCVEHFRAQKKAASDVSFQLRLDLKDFKQKYEDGQMVIQSQAAALARAERDCRFLTKKLSAHEEIVDYGNSEDGSVFKGGVAKKDPKSVSSSSKSGAASKTSASQKGSDTSIPARNEMKLASKPAASGFEDSLHPLQHRDSEKSKGRTSFADSNNEEDISTSELAMYDEHDEGNITSEQYQNQLRNQNSEVPPESFTQSEISDSSELITLSNSAVHTSTESMKQKSFRRHAEELKLSTVSCIYHETSNVFPSLDFATHVELGSLRNAQKSYEAKIRKLEHLLDDKEEQLKHCTVLMESSVREQARSRNHAIDLSVEVHSERSKLDTQLELNAELLRKISSLEGRLKSENQAMVALKIQESLHLKKLQDLTQKMQSFYQRCENYVQDERAPFLSLFCEFWIRLDLLRKDVDMIFALDSCDAFNFRSNSSDLSNYSGQEACVASFKDMLSGKSLSQLRDEVIRRFGICCSDVAASLDAYKQRQLSTSEKKEELKVLPQLAASSALHHTNTTLPTISKQDTSVPLAPQFAHKQFLPTIVPKTKLQTLDLMHVNDALYRNSDDVVEKLTSKLSKNKFFQEPDAQNTLLASWAKLAPTGAAASKPLHSLAESYSSTPSLSPPVHGLYPIHEEI
jgi:hypothetical protein